MSQERKIESLMQDLPFDKRLAKIFEQCPGEAPQIFREQLHSEGMGSIFLCREVIKLVERVLGKNEIRLYPNYALYPKMPSDQQPTETAWHAGRMAHLADYTEEQVRESMAGMVNVWTPLVPVTKTNGCVKLVPGSHKLDVLSLLPRPGSRGFHASRDKGYLEVDSELMKQHESKAVDIELEPGDVLLFKQQIIHCGNPNMSDGVRWSIDWRYQNAELHTLREDQGDIVRSLRMPEAVVRDGKHWASLPIHQGAAALNYMPMQKLRGIMALNDVAASRLREEGYVVIPKLLPTEVVDAVIATCEQFVEDLAASLLQQNKVDSAMKQYPFAKRLAKLFEAIPDEAPRLFHEELVKNEAMGRLFFCPQLLDVVENTLGSDGVHLYPNFYVLPRMQSRDKQTRWHAGRILSGLRTQSDVEDAVAGMINVWTPLVPVNKQNGAMRVIPGSHKVDVISLLPQPKEKSTTANQKEAYLEVDPSIMKKYEHKAVDIDMSPGDILLFDQRLIHCGNPNMTDDVRWSIDWRYVMQPKPGSSTASNWGR
jgi:phytanoyl-CoA hydroxylase